MKKIFTSSTILVAIILLAFLLRFWQLGQVPLGFHADEAAYGYNAYSLSITGKDEYGKSFPLLLKSFGEYKPALYAYLTIPWIAVFDLHAFAVRATSALFGSLSVLMIYLLTTKLLQNRRVGMLAALLLAVSPWHLNLSRTVSEVVVSLFFILLLVYSFTFLKEKLNLRWLTVAVLSGILAIETYTASRFFVVILSVLWFLSSFKKVEGKVSFNLKILLVCGLFVLMGAAVSFFDGANRFNQISITTSPRTQLVLEEQIREDQFTPPVITRIFHNKVVNYGRTIIYNYFEYFTPGYLFLYGGYPQRMHLPDSGLLYMWQVPFLLVGSYLLLRRKDPLTFFLFSWWLVLLLPAALTFDEIPNVYRSLIVLPPILIVTALGLEGLFTYQRLPKIVRVVGLAAVVVIGIFEFAYYQHQYYRHQEVHQPWYRGYAYQELATSLRDLYPVYPEMIITKANESPYIYLLFYYKYDPALYQSQGSPRDLTFAGFDKYRFTPMDCPLSLEAEDPDNITMKKNVLYVNKGSCPIPEKNVKLLKTIYWQDHTPAFQLIEYTPGVAKK